MRGRLVDDDDNAVCRERFQLEPSPSMLPALVMREEHVCNGENDQ